MSVTYACATVMLPPVTPSRMREANSTHGAYANPSSTKLSAVPIWLTTSTAAGRSGPTTGRAGAPRRTGRRRSSIRGAC
ncbi:MAG: hypothetical protein U0470_10655 [Anaerolineae bacterium]